MLRIFWILFHKTNILELNSKPSLPKKKKRDLSTICLYQKLKKNMFDIWFKYLVSFLGTRKFSATYMFYLPFYGMHIPTGKNKKVQNYKWNAYMTINWFHYKLIRRKLKFAIRLQDLTEHVNLAFIKYTAIEFCIEDIILNSRCSTVSWRSKIKLGVTFIRNCSHILKVQYCTQVLRRYQFAEFSNVSNFSTFLLFTSKFSQIKITWCKFKWLLLMIIYILVIYYTTFVSNILFRLVIKTNDLHSKNSSCSWCPHQIKNSCCHSIYFLKPCNFLVVHYC